MDNGNGRPPILVDDRTGSDRLGKYLIRRRQPVDVCRLQFGDVAFMGNGPDDRPVAVGAEYKTVGDCLKCITDGRFAGHQLVGLSQSYEVVILLVEGDTRPNPQDGTLEVRHPRGFWYDGKVGERRFQYRELDHWLMTMQFKAGVKVIRTSDLDGSVQSVIDLYTWWVDKSWADHRSHLSLTDAFRDDAVLIKPNLVRRMAKELPSIGWDRSKTVAKRFRSVFDMVMADERDWGELPGIGPKTASSVVKALRGE